MKVLKPDYSNSIINLMNSIRLFFNLSLTHSSLKDIDEILKKSNKKKVILMLLDGMGSKIIDKHLSKDSFIQSHKFRDFYSSFPSTTVAATTTARSCLNPIESGYLGWSLYLKNIDDILIAFTDKQYYGNKYYPKNTVSNYLPYENFVDTLSNKGYKACEIFPSFKKDCIHAYSFSGFLRKIKKANKSNDYIYAYWGEPDTTLHFYGTSSNKAHRMLNRFDKKLENFYKSMDEDTIMFIIADHGHIDTSFINVMDYPDLYDTLKLKPSIEPRNATVFIKDGRKEEFEKLFNKYLSDDFILIKKDDLLKDKMFGDGFINPKSLEFIGDYQIVAIANKTFECLDNNKKFKLKSSHAGLNEDEMLIPLIIVNK